MLHTKHPKSGLGLAAAVCKRGYSHTRAVRGRVDDEALDTDTVRLVLGKVQKTDAQSTVRECK